MNKIQRCQTIIRHSCLDYTPQRSALCVRNYCVKGDSTENVTNEEKLEIDDANPKSNILKRISQLTKHGKTVETSKCETFPSLLRSSKFINVNIKRFGTLFCIILFNNFFAQGLLITFIINLLYFYCNLFLL